MVPSNNTVGLDILGQDRIGIGVECVAKNDDGIQGREKAAAFNSADGVGCAAY